MKKMWKKYWLTLLGVLLGAVAGFLYWHFVGCESGACPITASPVNSTLWGALMGGLVGSMFRCGAGGCCAANGGAGCASDEGTDKNKSQE